MSNEPLAVSTEDVRRRARRFGMLRAAERALAFSMDPAAQSASAEEARGIRRTLQSLSERLRSAEPSDPEASRAATPGASELAAVDGALDRLASGLLEALDRIRFSQLRATLPDVAARHPDEVASVLDLVLSEGLDPTARLPLVDYLATLLCSEEQDGRRRVTKSPAEASARLAALAREAQAEADPACDAFEDLFRDGRLAIEQGEAIGSVVARVRDGKGALGRCLFQARVLAALVAYNVAVWNRMTALVETRRALDRFALDPTEEPPAEAPTAEDTPASPAAALSPFEAPGLDSLSRALAERLAGRDPGRGLAPGIAAALDVGEVTDWEKHAFEVADPAEPMPRALRAAVLVGLLLPRLSELEEPLRELGLDPRLVASDWLEAIDRELQKATQELLSRNEYQEACRLSEAKTRYLYAPLSKQRRERRRADPSRPADPTAFGPDPRREEISAYEAQRAREQERFAPPAHAGLGGLRDWLVAVPRDALAAALILVVGGMFFWNAVLGQETGAIRENSSQELSYLSRYIESGYRDHNGAGSVFVGTLGNDWFRADSVARAAEARAIGERLDYVGAKRVLLFDRNNRLQVQYQNGRLVFVAPPPRR